MLKELRRYYVETGTAAQVFTCRYAESCKAVCHDFVTPREAFVGAGYEDKTLPRILFVSLDASGEYPGREPSKRTLEYMRQSEEGGPDGCDPEKLPRNQHWYWTHKLAFDILKPVQPNLEFHDIHRYFAHTNSAKCKDAKRRSRQNHPRMFGNCRTFIKREIELLEPAILITQGKFGRLAVDGQFGVLQTDIHPEVSEYICQLLKIGGRTVLKFSTVHPRAVKFFNLERKLAYPWYIHQAQEFLLRDPKGSA